MPSRLDESPRLQRIRAAQPVGIDPAEASNLRLEASQIATPQRTTHPGFDADLNPIDDEFINTRGSER